MDGVPAIREPIGDTKMKENFAGRTILILKGATLAERALRQAFSRRGAHVIVTSNLICAFNVLQRRSVEAVVVDHSLHNEAFDFCTELQALNIPYIHASSPHRWRGFVERGEEAEAIVARVIHRIERQHDAMTLDLYGENELPDADLFDPSSLESLTAPDGRRARGVGVHLKL
jgi:hypothetical protein